MNLLKRPVELRNGYKDRKHLGKVAMMKCVACRKDKPPRITRLEVHHKTGEGAGKKASDLLTLPLCNWHHQKGTDGKGLHKDVNGWEDFFGKQEILILRIHEILGIDIYKKYLESSDTKKYLVKEFEQTKFLF